MISRRRIDVLTYEQAHGRLSPMAVEAGRRLQIALEATHRSGGSAWGQKVDTSCSRDAAGISAVEATRRATRQVEWAERHVGIEGVELLGAVLADGVQFPEIASRNGRSGRRATSDVASRFRSALEALALAQKTVGAVPSKVIDKHSRAAETISVRKKVFRAA